MPVEDLAQALAQRTALGDGQSLVSRDGYWVGRHFLRVRRGGEAEAECWRVARKSTAWARNNCSRKRRWNSEQQLQTLREQQLDLEEQREQLRRRSQEENRLHGELKASLSASRARRTGRAAPPALQEELAELEEQRALEHEQLGEARLLLQEAVELMAQDTEQREQLMARRDALRESLDRVRQEARQHKDHAHQLAVRLGSLRAQHDSTRALERLEQQAARLTERQEQLSLNLEEGEAPQEELRLKLEALLELRMSVDEEMRLARLHMDEADRELREAERRTQAEQQALLLRGQLEQLRLECQGLDVRRKTLQEQLLADGYDLQGCSPPWRPMPASRAPNRRWSNSRRVSSAWVRSTSPPLRSTSNNPSASATWMPRTPTWWSAGDPGKRHSQDRQGKPQPLQGYL